MKHSILLISFPFNHSQEGGVPMGKTTTPKYRLEWSDGTGGWQKQAWSGHATQKRLNTYMLQLAQSFEAGGANEHISKSFGYIPYPLVARIVFNTERDAFVVVRWVAPAFKAS